MSEEMELTDRTTVEGQAASSLFGDWLITSEKIEVTDLITVKGRATSSLLYSVRIHPFT